MSQKLATAFFLTSFALLATSVRIQGQQPVAGTTGGQAPVQTQGPAQPQVDDSQKPPAKNKAGGAAGVTGKDTGVKKQQKKGPTGPPQPPTPPAPPKPAWEQFTLNPKTTMFLDFTDANPDRIISIFSRTSGITILKDPNFKVPLTVTSATKVKLSKAFEIFNTVLGFNGYELQKKGDLMIVGKINPPPPPPMQPPPPPPVPVIKTYALEHASAQQVARVINEVFAPAAPANDGGGQPRGFPPGMVINGMQIGGPGGGGQGQKAAVKATSEDYSNSVVVNALPTDQDAVAALIKDLDKSSALPLETKIFRLKHVSADEAVDAIRDVLTANAPNGRGASKPQNQNQGGFFFGYDPFAEAKNQEGAQSATAIKQTNSVLVNATPENMTTIANLIDNLDQASIYVGTTFVIHLENAKSDDVAKLLNEVFTQKSTGNENPFYVYFGGEDPNQRKSKDIGTDFDDQGNLVNVRDLTGKVNINSDPNTNDLVIVTTPSNMPLIRRVVEQLDRVSDQVMIEVIIVEANLDRNTQLGVEFNFLKGTSSGQQNFGLQSGQATNGTLQGFQYTLNPANYSIFLNALQTDTRYTVLDTPRIFTSNNVKAEIDVSQKIPYTTEEETGIVGGLISSYSFLDVGVDLKVTPRITSAGQVTMDVDQSADALQGYTTFNAPIVNHREATTTVTVADGQTIILGGIISKTSTSTENKVPLLGDIPIIGNLFKSTSHDKNQTELMVLLTPHIVRHPSEATKLREDESKELSRPSQGELKQVIVPDGKKGGG